MAEKPLWRHLGKSDKKSSNRYVILHFALEEKTLCPLVVYTLADSAGPVWTRPCHEFFDGRFRQIDADIEEDEGDVHSPPEKVDLAPAMEAARLKALHGP